MLELAGSSILLKVMAHAALTVLVMDLEFSCSLPPSLSLCLPPLFLCLFFPPLLSSLSLSLSLIHSFADSLILFCFQS